MYRLALLGTISLTGPESLAGVLDAHQPKRVALLAYLAAARPHGPQRRDLLVALLWPELDEARARAALRQALHAIRKSLAADAIVSRGLETIDLSRDSFTCDLWELDAAHAANDHRRVLELYQGELVAGLHVSDAPGFEQWVDAERARLRALARNAAWIIAEDAARRRSAEASGFVRRALDLSGLDEGALRRGMSLLAEAGDRASAIACYERFAADLRRELEVEVDGSTRELATRIREIEYVRPQLSASEQTWTGGDVSLSRAPSASSTARETKSLAAPFMSRPIRRYRAIAAAVVGLTLGGVARLSLAADTALDPRRIDLDPFLNTTSIPSLSTIAQAATLDARTALTRVQGATVAASNGNAGTRIRGALRIEGDSVSIRAEVVDVRSGTVVRVVAGPRTPIDGAREAIPAFADRLTAAVATALYPGWGNALSEPPSFYAYRLFVAGMRDIKGERHERAIESFRRAFAEDSSFTAAGLLAAMESYQVRHFAVADTLTAAIERHRDTLRPIDEHLLDWIKHSLRGDRFSARAAMQAVVSLAPDADLAWLQLAIDNVETARPTEALAALDHIAPDIEGGEGWASLWATRIEALHLLGDHRRELVVARDGLSRHPDLRVLINYELRALAALGRVDELNTRLQSLFVRADSSALASESIVRQAAQELEAHGQAEAGRQLLRRLSASYTQPENAASSSPNPASVARTYYLLGDNARSAAFYDSVYRAHPRCIDCAGVLGVLAARQGDRESAERHARVLSDTSARRPFSFGRQLLWRAKIANALGDRRLASALLASAFADGLEFDVMTHADPDLRGLRPDSIYRAFAGVR